MNCNKSAIVSRGTISRSLTIGTCIALGRGYGPKTGSVNIMPREGEEERSPFSVDDYYLIMSVQCVILAVSQAMNHTTVM